MRGYVAAKGWKRKKTAFRLPRSAHLGQAGRVCLCRVHPWPPPSFTTCHPVCRHPVTTGHPRPSCGHKAPPICFPGPAHFTDGETEATRVELMAGPRSDVAIGLHPSARLAAASSPEASPVLGSGAQVREEAQQGFWKVARIDSLWRPLIRLPDINLAPSQDGPPARLPARSTQFLPLSRESVPVAPRHARGLACRHLLSPFWGPASDAKLWVGL